MDDKGKPNQSSDEKIQNYSDKHSQLIEDNKFDSEPFCRITWSDIFEDTLKRYADSIPSDIKSVCNPVMSQNNTKLCENLVALNKQITFQFQILVDQYKLVQSEHAKMLEKNENLIIVNKKILDRLHDITAKDKRKMVDQESQTQEGLRASEERIPDVQENHTQIQNKESLLNQSAASFHSPETLNESKFKKENSRNVNDKNRDANDLKVTKIIIYRVPEEIGIPDIIAAIFDTIQCPINSINFEKKYRLRDLGIHNYVFKIPHHTACGLLKSKCINIKCHSFSVRQFITVIRCFCCQAYNHYADSCTNIKICARCGDSHNSFNCHRSPRCINCIINNRAKMNFKTDHPAYSMQCESLKHYIKQQRLFLDTSF